MKIGTEKLLMIAGIVWIVAGVNVTLIGIGTFIDSSLPLWIMLGTLVVFLVFHVFIFQKVASKNATRIRGMEEDKKHFWHFLDKRGYIIMAVMMGGGIALRASGLLPDMFIAFFYSGLGLALAVAGISFIISYVRGGSACPFVKKQ